MSCCNGEPKWAYSVSGGSRSLLRKSDAADAFAVTTQGEQGATGPIGRASATLTVVRDGAGEEVAVLFGGFHPERGNLGDTWVWGVAGQSWRREAPLGGPSARSGHAAFADEDTVVVFGGDMLGDLWRFNASSSQWTPTA